MKVRGRQPAQIQFHGEPGITQPCVQAIVRLLHFGDAIVKAALLTCSNEHCFLLTINEGDRIAVKSGFASGYGGEGPRGLGTVLRLLERHGTVVEEYAVAPSVIRAIDECSLTIGQLSQLDPQEPIRPMRWFDYIYSIEGERSIEPPDDRLNAQFPTAIPYAIIDARLVDLALLFAANADGALLTGYRRLEDIVRQKADLVGESSTRLFARAFQGEPPLLTWSTGGVAEQRARATLFEAIFRAYRNPRAHRECLGKQSWPMREFLLLNELFHLESQTRKQAPIAQAEVKSAACP